MRLLLMRHGVAEDAGPATDHRDEARALTPAGIAKTAAAAEGLAVLDLHPVGIVTSPLVRCRQTAAIVGRALGLVPGEDGRLRPGMDLAGIADLLLEHPGVDPVLLCGHQPDLSRLVEDLTGGLVEFRKCALAVVDVESLRPRQGVLRALYPPATLRMLAG